MACHGIYKLLFDLLMIKTVLSLISHPVRWFVRIALLPLIFVVLLFFSMLGDISQGNRLWSTPPLC